MPVLNKKFTKLIHDGKQYDRVYRKGVKIVDNYTGVIEYTIKSNTSSSAISTHLPTFTVTSSEFINSQEYIFTLKNGSTTKDRNTALSNITKVTINYNKDIYSSISFRNLTNIDKINRIDLGSNLTNMSNMFNGCTSLTSINLSTWDTSRVTSMSGMFTGVPTSINWNYDRTNYTKWTLTEAQTGYSGIFPWNYIVVAQYTINTSSNVLPTFNSGYTYNVYTENKGNGVYLKTITSPSAPTSMKFYQNKNLLTIENLDVSNLTSMSEMFYACSNLKSVNTTGWDTSKVTTMYGMFSNCKSLTSINLSNLSISSLKNTEQMFYYCTSLSSVDLSTWNTSGLTNTEYMFCNILKTNWNYTGSNYANWTLNEMDAYYNHVFPWNEGKYKFVEYTVESTGDLLKSGYNNFYYYLPHIGSSRALPSVIEVLKTDGTYEWYSSTNANKVASIKAYYPKETTKISFYGYSEQYPCRITSVTNVDTSNFTDMSYMFHNCSKLVSVNTSSWNTNKVTNMEYMFHNCRNLTTINTSSWNTSNVTKMNYMFYYCTSLTSLDLSGFNTTNLTNVNHMFYYCTSLTSLNLSTWNTSNINNLQYMFYNVPRITNWSYTGSNYANWNLTELQSYYNYLFPWSDYLFVEYTIDKSSSDFIDEYSSKYFYLPEINGINNNLPSAVEVLKDDGTYGWYTTTRANETASIKAYYPRTTTTKIRFSGQSSSYPCLITSIISMDTSNFTDMSYMFQYCTKLTSVDTSTWNTSKVTDMKNMFHECSKLTSFNATNLDTSKVTDMNHMFYNCSSLITVDLSSFDTSKVTSVSHTFFGCSKLTSLNLTNFNTSSLVTTSYMCYGCSALTSVDLSSWDTKNIIYYGNMFTGCQQSCIGYYCPPIWTLPISGTGFDITWVAPFNIYTIDKTLLESNYVTLYNNRELEYPFTVWGDGTYNSNLDHTYNLSSISGNIITIHTNLYSNPIPNLIMKFIDTTSTATVASQIPAAIVSGSNSTSYYNYINILLKDGSYTTNTSTQIKNVEKVYLAYDKNNTINLKFTNLTNIERIEKLDITNSWTSFKDMFSGCSNLKEINMVASSAINNVTNTSKMFYNCSSLDTVDLSFFNTSKVSTYTNMFTGCSVIANWNYKRLGSFAPDMNYSQFKLTESQTGYSSKFPWNFTYVEYSFIKYEGETPSTVLDNAILPHFFDSTGKELPVGYNDIILTLTDGTITNDLSTSSMDIEWVKVYYPSNVYSLRLGGEGYSGGAAPSIAKSNLTPTNESSYTYHYVKEIKYIDLSEVRTLKQAFQYSCLEKINLGTATIKYATDLTEMFYESEYLTSIDMSGLTFTNKITNMKSMFLSCYSLESVTFGSLDTSMVTDMSYMFGNSAITNDCSTEIAKLKTNNVTDMSHMFTCCYDITTLDLSSWNTSNVTNLESMFDSCENLTSLNISSWNTSNVTNIASLFYYCSSLSNLNISSWNTASVTDMNYAFYGCSSLTSLNLANWNTSNVKNFKKCLSNCSSLSNLNISNWNISTEFGVNTFFMFQNTPITNWNYVAGSNYKNLPLNYIVTGYTSRFPWMTGDVVSNSYVIYTVQNYSSSDTVLKQGTGWPNYGFYYLPAWTCGVLDVPGYSTTQYDNEELMGKYEPDCIELILTNGTTTRDLTTTMDQVSKIKVYVPKSVRGISFCPDEGGYATSYLKTIEDVKLPYINSARCMFYQCKNLSSLNTTNWNLGNACDYHRMFDNCTSLSSVNVTNLVTSKAENLWCLFSGCYNVSTFDVSSWNTTNVTNIANLFSSCDSLTTVTGLGNLNTAKVTHAYNIFSGDYSLTSVDGIQNWDTSNFEDISYTFNECSSLTNINLTGWDTTKVTTVRQTFNGCSSLTSITNINNISLPNLTDVSGTFSGCSGLTSLNLTKWNTSKVTGWDFSGTFCGCSGLTYLNLSTWDTRGYDEDSYDMLSEVPVLTAEQWGYDGTNYTNFTIPENIAGYAGTFPW